MTKPADECRWCKTPLDPRTGPGRPRAFCSQACRQWDWVTRHAPADDIAGAAECVVVPRGAIEQLRTLCESLTKVLAESPDDEQHPHAQHAQHARIVELEGATQAMLKAIEGLLMHVANRA